MIGMAKPWLADDWPLNWKENPAEADERSAHFPDAISHPN